MQSIIYTCLTNALIIILVMSSAGESKASFNWFQVALGFTLSHVDNIVLQQSTTLLGLFASIMLSISDFISNLIPIFFHCEAYLRVTLLCISFNVGFIFPVNHKKCSNTVNIYNKSWEFSPWSEGPLLLSPKNYLFFFTKHTWDHIWNIVHQYGIPV